MSEGDIPTIDEIPDAGKDDLKSDIFYKTDKWYFMKQKSSNIIGAGISFSYGKDWWQIVFQLLKFNFGFGFSHRG